MRYRVGKAIGELSDSVVATAFSSVAIAGAAAAVEYVTHRTVTRLLMASEVTHAAADACVVGVVVGGLVWLFFSATRARRRRLLERVRALAEINHQIRNALQVIASSHYLPQPQQTEVISESVQRIDATLRELFPIIGERVGDRGVLGRRFVRQAELLQARRTGEISRS